MPATKSTRENSSSRRPHETWGKDLAQALTDLGSASKKFPELFPHGITKIELEIGLLTDKNRIKVLIEGPQKKDGAPDRTG